MLVEDEAIIAFDLGINLQSQGYCLVQFSSCTDASWWLERNHPDVAVIDVQLADVSCDHLAESLLSLSIPFNVHSADLPSIEVAPLSDA